MSVSNPQSPTPPLHAEVRAIRDAVTRVIGELKDNNDTA